MKKLETLKNELFENFKVDEIDQLNKIKGGVVAGAWTSHGSDYTASTGEYSCDLWNLSENYNWNSTRTLVGKVVS
jgi:predicted transcriptional regulator